MNFDFSWDNNFVSIIRVYFQWMASKSNRNVLNISIATTLISFYPHWQQRTGEVEILQNLQGNTCAEASFIKFADLQPVNLVKVFYFKKFFRKRFYRTPV